MNPLLLLFIEPINFHNTLQFNTEYNYLSILVIMVTGDGYTMYYCAAEAKTVAGYWPDPQTAGNRFY